MLINSHIFDYYLESGNIDKHKSDWIFKHLGKLSGGSIVCQEPLYSQEDTE